MRTRSIALSLLLVLPLLTACGPGTPPDDSPADPGGQGTDGDPQPSDWTTNVTETDVLGLHALATASNGAVLDITLIAHAPEPFDADGAADAWSRTTEWCAGEVDDTVISDQGYTFTTIDVTAQTVSGQWPDDTPLLLAPLPFSDATIATTGDVVVQANEPAQLGQEAGSVPHCQQPALLLEAGTGSIYIGIAGDIDGDGNGTPPFGGWANRKYGVNANLPSGTSDVTFSGCEVVLTPLAEELGAPTASWQEAFQDDFCIVGGDSVGVDAG